MRARVLLACAAACLALLALAPTSAAATDVSCLIESVVITYNVGTSARGAVFTRPAFDQNRHDSISGSDYELTVPADATSLYLTAYAVVDTPQTYIAYGVANGPVTPKNRVKQVGRDVRSGVRSQQLPLTTGLNTVKFTTTCGKCVAVYTITVTRPAISLTKGDPLFAGLLGQQYQVHGVANEIYSIISDRMMQMNSRFVFLDRGECPILNGKKAHACWSHPGSYLGELGIKTAGGDRVYIASGPADSGFKHVQLNGQELDIGDVNELRGNATVAEMDHDFYVVRNTTHLVTMQVSNFLLQIENSDHFVNYRLRVLDWSRLAGTHGLLGQTHQKPKHPKQIPYIEGSVDDYQIRDRDLFGDSFDYNQFGLALDQ